MQSRAAQLKVSHTKGPPEHTPLQSTLRSTLEVLQWRWWGLTCSLGGLVAAVGLPKHAL